ncbi:hypothetical protein [Hymenobacter chitinivorans]|uniref:Uncharacterized protein n=1 Tax=Hymenobacter chitinivorans DSM 11115 TaxID=1121954 RepID=A0A2M9BAJ6_9BACT|nr:hypothetical protein [Hymenobacter chitinivorans]PJJ54966.1 hypothetical protein CLV45_3314 [Hymenobacter chitinivorans DSM 11115]
MRTYLTLSLLALGLSGAFLSCSTPELDDLNAPTRATQATNKKAELSAPTLSTVEATQTSITLRVTAGAGEGAPAGFSLQWMSAADYVANGNSWLSSDDPRLFKASFSGNANQSRYNLAPNQSVTVNIGEMLFDNGASTTSAKALSCITQQYVFRAFAHATSSLQRSDFTAPYQAATLSCRASATCTFTQDYWRTHGPIPVGNNRNEWPLTSLTLGTTTYTDLQALSILNTPAEGSALLTLAHQLIAAKLNEAKGADATSISQYIGSADAQLGSRSLLPGTTTDQPTSSYLGAVSTLTQPLLNYNEGATGPGHCAEAED